MESSLCSAIGSDQTMGNRPSSSNSVTEAILEALLGSPNSSSNMPVQADQVDQVNCERQIPKWLDFFLQKTFFDSCTVHEIRRNEKNKYCINCNASVCQYCVTLGPHHKHKLLKIYRHVYKDVVPLDEIEEHLDCTAIQPYRCNRQLVIALTPLPHSGSKPDDEATCEICKRRLVDATVYSYCSISCKVEAYFRKQDDSTPPFLLLKNDEMDKPEDDPQPVRKTHRRKGVPHRSPLF